jgi:hypothetical protein
MKVLQKIQNLNNVLPVTTLGRQLMSLQGINSKTIVAGSILLFLVLVGNSLLLQSQTTFAQLESGGNASAAANNTNATTATSESLTTNTYENPEWGISMQYPSNWTASTNGLRDYRDLIAFYPPLENFTELFPAELIISASRYSQDVSLPALTNFTLTVLNQSKQLSDESQEAIEIKSSADVIVAGLPGHRIVLAYEPFQNKTQVMNIYNIWTALGDKVYMITYQGEEMQFNQHMPQVGRILESFRITPNVGSSGTP